MFPNFCGAMGFAGWLVTLLAWTGVVAVVVWGITRLFPGPSGPARLPRLPRPSRRRRSRSEKPPSLAESGRR